MTTPQKRALKVAGHELAALADELPNPAWIAHADGDIFWFNRAWYDYIGTAHGDSRGWAWAQIHHPDELDHVAAVWREAIASGKAIELTFPLKGKDGKYRPFLTRVVPIRDEAGMVVRWFGTNVDISAQLAAAERLRRAEEDWLKLFDEMHEGFLIVELVKADDGVPTDAIIIQTNKNIERLTGIKPSDALGATISELTGEAAPWLLELFARVIETGRSETMQIDVARLGRSFEIRAYRHADHYAAIVYLDISERRMAEAEARRAQVSLLRVSRLNAMGAMASTLAHELNQPLGTAVNYLAAASEQLKRLPGVDSTSVTQFLASASESCLKAGRIIRSMREFAATGKVAASAEDLKEMISATIAEFLGSETHDGLLFDFTCPDDLPTVMCDRIQIEQVLVNLYSNSARAMGSTRNRLIRIEVTVRRDAVLIRLGDSGPGFSERSPEELFEPFWSTTDVGLGLGLPLCRTIVEAHRGTIRAEPAHGGGAAFVIQLPLSKS